MVKVITYGTFDLLHHGHIRLLERARALGDYLIVGVTVDDFDKTRGKINVHQNFVERLEAVRATGIADEIIAEEYEGQKIDDIIKLGVDIFAIGSDWTGKFDYLNGFCKVVYLPRTKGISSSELRTAQCSLILGIVGDSVFLNKMQAESLYVNGINIRAVCTNSIDKLSEAIQNLPYVTSDFNEFLKVVDAVYIRSLPREHFSQISQALIEGKHVLCEAPMTLKGSEWKILQKLAKENGLILMDAVKTAYITAYSRLLLLVNSGKIGKIMSVDATCTSLVDYLFNNSNEINQQWDNIYEWGPTALLPVFQLLGSKYLEFKMTAHFIDKKKEHDSFVKMDFRYPTAVASIKVGNGVKSEGELVISGTSGYVYVPAPWWKTDYFEIRYENPADNKRYFYQLEGEGIRHELVAFAKAVEFGENKRYISENVSEQICIVMEEFNKRKNVFSI